MQTGVLIENSRSTSKFGILSGWERSSGGDNLRRIAEITLDIDNLLKLEFLSDLGLAGDPGVGTTGNWTHPLFTQGSQQSKLSVQGAWTGPDFTIVVGAKAWTV